MTETVDLAGLVNDFAQAIKRIDQRRPQWGRYQPGIGPHPETKAVALVVDELVTLNNERYEGRLKTEVRYADQSRRKCDLCIGHDPNWEWAIEVKMLRLMGDNNKPNDNMMTHILSPYPQDRSALTDCTKLIASGLQGRKAVLIYGFDYSDAPMDLAIEAFEVLAHREVCLGEKYLDSYNGLVHPVHQSGRVFAWEISKRG